MDSIIGNIELGLLVPNKEKMSSLSMQRQSTKEQLSTRHWATSPLGWVAIAAIVVSLDFLSGPVFQFPILLVVPVTLAAWHGGLKWGLTLSLVLPLFRIVSYSLNAPSWPVGVTVSNALIRMLTLAIMAFFASVAAEMSREVLLHRRLLTVCRYCRRTVGPSGEWERPTTAISEVPTTELSFVVCPDCAHERYPAIFPSPGS
jgi:hypothetical protein